MRERRMIDAGVATCQRNWEAFSEGQQYRYSKYTGGRVVVEDSLGGFWPMSNGCFVDKFKEGK